MQGSIVDRRSPSMWQKLTEAMDPPWFNWPLSPRKHQEAGGLWTSLSPPGLPTLHHFPVSTMGNFQEIQLQKCISTNPYGMSMEEINEYGRVSFWKKGLFCGIKTNHCRLWLSAPGQIFMFPQLFHIILIHKARHRPEKSHRPCLSSLMPASLVSLVLVMRAAKHSHLQTTFKCLQVTTFYI